MALLLLVLLFGILILAGMKIEVNIRYNSYQSIKVLMIILGIILVVSFLWMPDETIQFIKELTELFINIHI